MKIKISIKIFLLVNIIYSQTPGTEKWHFKTFSNVRSTPAIESDGTIYFGSDDNNVYALYPDGSKKWEFKTDDHVSSSPALGSDGTIFVGSFDGKLYAINRDGSKKWEFNFSGGIRASPAISVDGTIYIGSNSDTLYAIDPSGNKLWGFATGKKILSSPAIDNDGTIYVGSNDSTLYAINPSGSEKWKFKTGNGIWMSSPAIDNDGTIYVGSDDSMLYAINNNGTKKWAFNIGGAVGNSPTIGSDGTIYIATVYHNFTLFAINPNGTLKWNHITCGFFSSATIGKDGTIYIGTNGCGLLAINPDGSTKWTADIPNELMSSPVITADSLVLIGSSFPQSSLYAIHCENNKYFDSSWPKFRRNGSNTGNIQNVTSIESSKTYILFQPTLYQNYPNPFNPDTQIGFKLINSTNVRISIYDITGKKIKTIVNKNYNVGKHNIEFDASKLSSGIYIYELKTGSYRQSRKMLLVR